MSTLGSYALDYSDQGKLHWSLLKFTEASKRPALNAQNMVWVEKI